MDTGSLLIGFAIGAVAGICVAAAWLARRAAAAGEGVRRLEAREGELVAEVQRERNAREELDRQAAALHAQLTAERQRIEDTQKGLEQAQRTLTDAFARISQESLQASNSQFLKLAETKFKPFEDLLGRQQIAVAALEAKRAEDYGWLKERSKQLLDSNETLRAQTAKLETALRRPEQRGRWGEMALRNVVESAGMTEHCDFDEQVTTGGDEAQRPDMVVHLPGGGEVVVDAKVPMEHYLDACEGEGDVASMLDQHATQVERHVNALSSKQYWKQFEQAPQFVVMFIPVESALVAALERRPDLHAKAMKSNVLVVTPMLLIALLQAVAFGWRQESVAENAREIAQVGQLLFERLSVFRDHLDRLGDRVRQATEAYNSAVGSFNTRLEPGARRLSDLHASGGDEMEPLTPIDVEPRRLEPAPTDN